ncbi:hypothetical protein B0H11DRAFT_2079025 [Mycena galericulata]|nr:hypothetical protein B0H11DRAFT_2079025 [Mycena galericulata]
MRGWRDAESGTATDGKWAGGPSSIIDHSPPLPVLGTHSRSSSTVSPAPAAPHRSWTVAASARAHSPCGPVLHHWLHVRVRQQPRLRRHRRGGAALPAALEHEFPARLIAGDAGVEADVWNWQARGVSSTKGIGGPTNLATSMSASPNPLPDISLRAPGLSTPEGMMYRCKQCLIECQRRQRGPVPRGLPTMRVP